MNVAGDNQLQIDFAIINDTLSGSGFTGRMIALLMNKELERILRNEVAP
jgi:hypothetical protein